MNQNQPTTYLRYDLTTLAVIVLVMATAMYGLWYAEQHGSWFSRTATQLLDALSR